MIITGGWVCAWCQEEMPPEDSNPIWVRIRKDGQWVSRPMHEECWSKWRMKT